MQNDWFSQFEDDGQDWFSQFDEKPEQKLGWEGVKEDVYQSLSTLPNELIAAFASLPSEAMASGRQIATDPLRAGSNVAGGLVKGLTGAANIPYNVREYLLEKQIPLSSRNPYPKFEPTALEKYLISSNVQPGDVLLQGLGQFSPYSRIGAGASGLKGVAQRAAGVGAMGVGDEGMDPLHAAIGGVLGEGLGAVAKKTASPLFRSEERLPKGIELGDVKETVEAAKRLGLDYITPGEASGFGYIGKQEGRIGNTLEGSKLREQKAKERAISEEKVIDSFLDKLDDRIALPKEKQKLYDSVMSKKLPKEIAVDFAINDENIAKAIKNVDSKAAYRQELKGVPRESFKFWDLVKRSMDDEIQSAKRKGRIDEARLIDKSRSTLVEKMDNIEPDYQRARKLAQRSIMRRKIEDSFDKKEKNASNFNKNVLSSEKGFMELYDSLSEFPDMQKTLTDMRLVFPKIYGTEKAKGAVRGERAGYETPRTDLAWLTRYLKQKFDEKGDVGDVKAMTSPDWINALLKNESRLAPRTVPESLEQLISALTKSSLQESNNE